MNLKTLFSKSIIKSDFKRYWWISALFALLIAFSYTFRIFIDVMSYTSYFRTSLLHIYVNDEFIVLSGFLFPVILGVLLFSYLQKGKNVTFFHSLPLSRKSLFFSHIFSGLVLFILPLLVNLLVSFAIIEGFDVSNYIGNSSIYECIVTSLIYGILLFCLSALVSSFMGNTAASFIFTYVFYFLALAVEGFIKGFGAEMLHGFPSESSNFFTLKLYFFDNTCSFEHIVTYSIFSVILLAAGYIVYKKRSLENHSEIVAFPKLKIVFIMGTGLVFGAIGYLYFLDLNQTNSVLTFIPFGLVGIIISAMISAKSFRVPKIYKPVGMFLGLILVLFLIFDADILGYENYVPDASKVESVTFEHYNRDRLYNNITGTGGYIDDAWYEYDRIYTPTTTDPETIEKICTLHRRLIKSDYPTYSNSAKIIYRLENGRTVTRFYYFSSDEVWEELKAVVDSDLKDLYFPVLRDEIRNYEMLVISDKKNEPVLTLTNEKQINEIIGALKKDINEASAHELLFPSDKQLSFSIDFTVPAHLKHGERSTGAVPQNEYYEIYESYKNTLTLLEKYNIGDLPH